MARSIISTILIFGLLLVHNQSLSLSMSYSQFGDVIISNSGGRFRCDKIYCPEGTAQCQVTKSKQSPQADMLVRRNVCLGSDGTTLKEQTFDEPSWAGENVQLNVVSGNGGSSVITSSDFDAEAFSKNLNEHLSNTFKKVGETIRNSLNWG